LNPIAVHLIWVFAIGVVCALGYIWVRRVLRRRSGLHDPKLTTIGALLLVTFVLILGLGVVARQFFPETVLGSWLRTEGVMMNFVIACVAVLTTAEVLLRWLHLSTSEEEGRRDV
jgi:hypothetical protein